MVADDAGLAPFGAASKLDTDRAFLARLFGLGRAAADRWLAAHRADVGVRWSFDIEAEFLTRPRQSPAPCRSHGVEGHARREPRAQR